MSLDQDSDPPLVFPDSPTPIINDLDTSSSDESEITLARPSKLSGVEAGLARFGGQYPIMEGQEVEAESDTESSLRAEARAQRPNHEILKIKIRRSISGSMGKNTCQVSNSKRKTRVMSESDPESKKSVSMRKRARIKNKHTESDSQDNQSSLFDTIGSENGTVTVLNDDEPASEDSEKSATPLKRRPGWPRGSVKPKIALPAVQPVQRLDASVYVNLGVPPKLIRGRTHKGDKLEPQKPKQYGPFTLTANMSWNQFLVEVSILVDIELENLDINEMTWSFQKKWL
ncbi:hypothetical protein C0993_000772 [Termitomyces sp. T159_Od127]|nr:hypothetical protein C0993_000772 [Termitomyces sp. T159_Od127]